MQKGTKAPQAAGRIHTDFEKGFIMAEVMKFDDFKEEGSEAALKVYFIDFSPHFYLIYSMYASKVFCFLELLKFENNVFDYICYNLY